MTPDVVVDVFNMAVFHIMMMTTVILIPGLVVGLLVAIFQAATQINEMSMSFVPKFMVTLGTLLIGGHWLLSTLMEFARNLILEIPFLIG